MQKDLKRIESLNKCPGSLCIAGLYIQAVEGSEWTTSLHELHKTESLFVVSLDAVVVQIAALFFLQVIQWSDNDNGGLDQCPWIVDIRFILLFIAKWATSHIQKTCLSWELSTCLADQLTTDGVYEDPCGVWQEVFEDKHAWEEFLNIIEIAV